MQAKVCGFGLVMMMIRGDNNMRLRGSVSGKCEVERPEFYVYYMECIYASQTHFNHIFTLTFLGDTHTLKLHEMNRLCVCVLFFCDFDFGSDFGAPT